MQTTTTCDEEQTTPLRAMRSGLIEALGNEARGGDAGTLLAILQQATDELRAAQADKAAPLFRPLDGLGTELLDDYTKRQAAAARHGGVVGVRTGLDHLDEALNGLEPGKLYMLAAMPGAGKTTLALQWAASIAQAGAPALYISLENDAIDLARKTACRMGQVSYAAALKGKLPNAAWRAAVSRLGKLQGRLYVTTPRVEMPDPVALVEGIKAEQGQAPALIVIDYLQAWVKRDGSNGVELRERVDRFVPLLRQIGETYGCAVLAISSQNRASYQNGGMQAMKESGDIEYNADAVLSLSRDEPEGNGNGKNGAGVPPRGSSPNVLLKLTIDKSRQGLTGRPMLLTLRGDLCMVEERDE